MEYCKYHPLVQATYHCPTCQVSLCDQCVEEDAYHKDQRRCFKCGLTINFLGAGHLALPFWRNLQGIFRYPLKPNTIGFIIVTALLSAAATKFYFAPFAGLALLVVISVTLLHYSFACMSHTALGEMTPPPVRASLEGGIKVLLELGFIYIAVSALLFLTGYFISFKVAILLGIVLLFLLPALLISYVSSESVLRALNPKRWYDIIAAIGSPYGLLLAFIMIMASSVLSLQQWIGALAPSAALLLQGVVSNYYLIVIFHLMGYMLYQYQSQLGYTARTQDQEVIRTEAQRYLNKLDVLLKEGDYENLVEMYKKAFNRFPDENIFFHQYFEFIYACRRKNLMHDFASRYLDRVANDQHSHQSLAIIYSKANTLINDFVPNSPKARFNLARIFRAKGNTAAALTMLNGLHEQHPDFPELVPAYQLLATCLDETPGRQAEAKECLALLAQLEQRDQRGLTKAKPSADQARGTNPAKASAPDQSSHLELIPMSETKRST